LAAEPKLGTRDTSGAARVAVKSVDELRLDKIARANLQTADKAAAQREQELNENQG